MSDEKLMEIKQILIDWCKKRMEYNQDINFNLKHCVGKTHIKFTTDKIDYMLPPTNDYQGEWNNGHYIFYEINNRPNKVYIYLVIGIKDMPHEHKDFIDFLLHSMMDSLKVQKTYCIKKFKIYKYTDETNICLIKDEIEKRLNHVFETEIIEYEKEIEKLWTLFWKNKKSIDKLEKNKLDRLITAEEYNEELEANLKNIGNLSDKEINARILKGDIPERITIVSKIYKRNPAVVIATLRRANGYCEKCGCKAPFNRKSDNTPYLEVHHKIPLSNGGLDDLENTIAVCPNCHREFHFGF